MSYMVVETYKTNKESNSITEFFVALPGWLDGQNNIVYYPRIHSKEELSNVNSTYAPDWIPRILKKVWHTSLTFYNAKSLVDIRMKHNSGISIEEDNVNRRLKKYSKRAPKSLPQKKKYLLIKPSEDPPETSLSTTPPPIKKVRISQQPEENTQLEEKKLEEKELEPVQKIVKTIANMQTQLNEISEKVDAQDEAISKIYGITKNISSVLTQYFKDGKTTEAAAPSTKRPVENMSLEQFDDLEAIEPFKTSKDLVNFEQLLANKTYTERFIRFLKCKYNFDTLKAKSLFGLVLHQLTTADLFTNYTWKGNSRNGEQNISFATKHEKFVKFITLVVRMFDVHVSNSDVEEWFSSRLRQKKKLFEREKNRTTEPKLPAPRTRLPKHTEMNANEVTASDENGQGNGESQQSQGNQNKDKLENESN